MATRSVPAAVVSLGLLLVVSDAVAQIGGAFITVRPEMHVRQRQAIMVSLGKYYFPLAAMAVGKLPYDPKAVLRNAAHLEGLSTMPWDNFVETTATGQKTNALPDIYKEPAKFTAATDRLRASVERLAAAGRAGNEAGAKVAIGDIGRACGGCHESFRAKAPL